MAKSKAKNRPNRTSKRVPLSEQRGILTVRDKDENYEYRWVNDKDSRIETLQQRGYEFVDDDVEVGDKDVDSSKGVSSVVSKAVGGGVDGYLMRIKKEYFEEDKAFKAEQIDKREADMKRTLNDGKDGTYGAVEIK